MLWSRPAALLDPQGLSSSGDKEKAFQCHLPLVNIHVSSLESRRNMECEKSEQVRLGESDSKLQNAACTVKLRYSDEAITVAAHNAWVHPKY